MRRFVVCTIVCLSLLIVSTGCKNETTQTKEEANPPVTTTQNTVNKIIGRWLRTDGGYVIEVTNVSASGMLDAAYYNPNPIHIAESGVSEVDEQLKLFIKLQDRGYPGSTYDLTYDRTHDRLTGIYFQATMKQEFDVIFERMQ